MNYLLALDEGTSSTRAMLYDTSGKLLRMSQEALASSFPQPGWVEQCPEAIWNKTLSVMTEVTDGIDRAKIKGFGISNQRETTVLWDKYTGQCLYPAIVWQDRRSEAYCRTLGHAGDLIRQKTGLLVDPYFSASKLHWLLNHVPEARRLADKNRLAFGTIDSFLLWRFTKGRVHATDVTNASRTLLFDIINRRWDEDLLALFDLPASMLPEVRACDADFGVVDASWLGQEIPITGVAGDQQAALVGQHCLQPGMIKATYGTGAFLLMNTGKQPVRSNNRLLTTIACQIGDELSYGLEGSIYHAGSTVKWLRDQMKMITCSAETESMAAGLSSNDGVYLVPSFTGLGAPHWLSTSGAVISGLSRQSTPSHIARAALESVCYQTRDVLECMNEDSGLSISSLRVDGGMSSNHWMLRFLASQCKVVVQRPFNIETTGLGAAILAAIGCGEISSPEAMTSAWICDTELAAEGDQKQAEIDYQGWLDALAMLQKDK